MALATLDSLLRVALHVPVAGLLVVVLVLKLDPADAVDLLIDELLVAGGAVLGRLVGPLAQLFVLVRVAADQEIAQHAPRSLAAKGVQDATNGSTKFGLLGSGQCGGRLVESFYKLGYRKAMAVNTAYHDLDDLKLPQDQKFLMDIGPQGAGKDMSRGRDAALQYREEVVNSFEHIFCNDIDHLMVAFGAGGGTGSGSAIPLLVADGGRGVLATRG